MVVRLVLLPRAHVASSLLLQRLALEYDRIDAAYCKGAIRGCFLLTSIPSTQSETRIERVELFPREEDSCRAKDHPSTHQIV